jgi:PAS domain S-box-containing protein
MVDPTSDYPSQVNGQAVRNGTAETVDLYRQAFQALPLGLYVYHLEEPGNPLSLRLLSANAASERLTGANAEQVVGKRIGEAFPNLVDTQIPDLYHRLALEGGQIDIGEVPYQDAQVRDGIYRVTAFGMGPGLVGVSFENVTEQKRQAATRMRSEALLQAIASNFPNGALVLFDRDLRYLLVDGLGLAEVGLNKQEMEGRTIYEVFPPEVASAIEVPYRQALAGETIVFEHPFADRVYLVTNVPIRDETGAVVYGLSMTQDITARRKAERAASFERVLGAVARSFPNGALALFDRDLRYILVDGTALNEVGYNKEMMEGRTLYEVFPPELVSVSAEPYRRVIAGEASVFETSFAGNTYQTTAVPIRDETGAVVYGLMLSQNITARKRAETELHKRAVELQTVAEIAQAASTERDIDRLLQGVVELTKDRFDLYHAHIYLYDEAAGLLRMVAGAGEPGRIMKERGHSIPYDREHSLVARAARTRRGVLSNDVTQEPDFLPNPLLPDTLSEMAVPMIAGDQLIGVLDVQSDVLARFDDEDIRIMTTLAAQVAVTVENARAIQQILLHEAAIQNSTSGLTIADATQPDMPLVYINPAFERITGYSIQEAMGRNCRFLQGDDRDQPGLDKLRAAIREGRNATVVLRNYRKDGSLFYNELRLSPIYDRQGRLTHFVGVQTDISERMQVELERERLLEQERETVERLRQVDHMKSQFLANMSHELRTPLNSIIGYSEVLLDGTDGAMSEEAQEDVRIIHSSGRHLLAVINDILDLAKIEAGEMRMDREYVRLPEMVDEIVRSAQVLVKDKPVALRWIEDDPVETVYADPVRLRQIIMNLVSNAAKFTEQGSVTIRYGLDSASHAYISVTDTGIGIDETHLGEIFEQFRQVDGSSTRRAGGTGLGLTITRHLVRMHGGEITVSSKPGAGSTFRFTVPLYQPDAQPA